MINLKKKKSQERIGEKIEIFFAHESRRSGQGVRFATSGLSVAKRRAAEAFDRHFDEIFNAGVLQNVLLRGIRFENDIVGKYLWLFVAAARNHIALQNK